MIHPRDITTEAEAAVLEHADRLAAVIGKHGHPTDDTARDDVMLLVADLLRAHAETGIEMQTWRAARDVVLDHLAAEPEGADLLHRLGRPTWFTVIGTTKGSHREANADSSNGILDSNWNRLKANKESRTSSGMLDQYDESGSLKAR